MVDRLTSCRSKHGVKAVASSGTGAADGAAAAAAGARHGPRGATADSRRAHGGNCSVAFAGNGGWLRGPQKGAPCFCDPNSRDILSLFAFDVYVLYLCDASSHPAACQYYACGAWRARQGHQHRLPHLRQGTTHAGIAPDPQPRQHAQTYDQGRLQRLLLLGSFTLYTLFCFISWARRWWRMAWHGRRAKCCSPSSPGTRSTAQK